MCPAPSFEISYVGEDDSEFFRRVHGRTLNTMNTRYMLPADADEVRRSEFHHRMIQFLFGGKNHVGPVKEILRSHGQPRRVLDLGTGGGIWWDFKAIQMADEFPRVEVTGIDLAPIQPKTVPPNCTFELCDLDQRHLPYPDGHFDLIHARSMHIGIQDYPRFLDEISRLLRPCGLLIIIEPDPKPLADGKPAPSLPHASGLPGWFALWDTYHSCLRKLGIDLTVPRRLTELIASTGVFDKIITQEGNIPIGFWPKDDLSLTVGQLAWMDYDLLLPAMKPLFLSAGVPDWKVNVLIEDAQRDLYYPVVHPSSRIHIVHAIKKM